MKVELQHALAMLQPCSVLVHCKNTPIFLLQCHQAPLSPSEFSLFHTSSSAILCRSNSLIYPSVCPPVSFDAALRLICANIINLHCPWLCWREGRECRGEQGTELQCVCMQGGGWPCKIYIFHIKTWQGFLRRLFLPFSLGD